MDVIPVGDGAVGPEEFTGVAGLGREEGGGLTDRPKDRVEIPFHPRTLHLNFRRR
jgi:hypothetical protein